MGFEAVTEINIKIMGLYDAASHRWVDAKRHLTLTCYLHRQCRKGSYQTTITLNLISKKSIMYMSIESSTVHVYFIQSDNWSKGICHDSADKLPTDSIKDTAAQKEMASLSSFN
jgi:hypothetical protein